MRSELGGGGGRNLYALADATGCDGGRKSPLKEEEEEEEDAALQHRRKEGVKLLQVLKLKFMTNAHAQKNCT